MTAGSFESNITETQQTSFPWYPHPPPHAIIWGLLGNTLFTLDAKNEETKIFFNIFVSLKHAIHIWLQALEMWLIQMRSWILNFISF